MEETYAYDAMGNRLSALGVLPFTYNSSNHLTSTPSATFTYDDNGNTVSKTEGSDTTTNTWDFENRLTTVTLPDQSVVTFDYDPFGRRIRKVASATTIFVYDGANIVEEVDGSGAVLARYTQALGIDEPLAMLRGSTTHYYQADGLGSITALGDSSGILAASYTYDSFGNLSASTGSLTNPFRYTAREFDAETGLYYYRARYFDTQTGRFLSEDPLQFQAGLNFFTYVANNPIRFTDPKGLVGIEIHRLGIHRQTCLDDYLFGASTEFFYKITYECRPSCPGWALSLRLDVGYRLYFSPCSREHEFAHFHAAYKTIRNRVLPGLEKFEKRSYESKEECEAAGRTAQRAFNELYGPMIDLEGKKTH